MSAETPAGQEIQIKMTPAQMELIAIRQSMRGLSRTKQKELRRKQPRSRRSKFSVV